MRTETVNIYAFDELSDDAKKTAHERYLSIGDCFLWWSEWQDSLNAFCAIAPIEYIRYDVIAGHIEVRFTESDIAELSGVRAWKWLENNGWFDLAKLNAQGVCTLTGYCGDCPLFDPIAALDEKPQSVPDLKQLFYECLQSWVFECHEKVEHFAEMAEANNWEFYINGEMV